MWVWGGIAVTMTTVFQWACNTNCCCRICCGQMQRIYMFRESEICWNWIMNHVWLCFCSARLISQRGSWSAFNYGSRWFKIQKQQPSLKSFCCLNATKNRTMSLSPGQHLFQPMQNNCCQLMCNFSHAKQIQQLHFQEKRSVQHAYHFWKNTEMADRHHITGSLFG